MEEGISFSQQQMDYLAALHYINRIDEQLRIVSHVRVIPMENGVPPRVLLLLDLIYHDSKIDSMSFNLHNYSFDEIVETAKTISSNEFILQEVDNFLAGSGE